MEFESFPPPQQPDDTAERLAEEQNKNLAKYEKLIAIVEEHPEEFETWTQLVQITEKLNGIEKIRTVFDGFLYEFPLCYAYWKKYADHEHRRGNTEHARAIYERGVAAVAYSPDLWVHYANFVDKVDDPDTTRSLFERALEYVGNDFLSGSLWRRYAEFEMKLPRREGGVVELFSRILTTPLKDLDSLLELFKRWVKAKAASETLPEEEAAALRPVVRAELIEMEEERLEKEQEKAEEEAKKAAEEAAAAAAKAKAAKEMYLAPPIKGFKADEGEGSKDDDMDIEEKGKLEDLKNNMIPPEVAEEEEVHNEESLLKKKFVDARVAMAAATKEGEVARVLPYERLIKRPYFHIKALDEAQRRNWHRYLDFEEARGDTGRVIRMYERCLIPCASYPEFWIRYARRAEEMGVDQARAVLQRAGGLFVKRRAEIHLFVAQFEERHGSPEAARVAFELVNTQLAPGLLEGIVRQANFERRQGQEEAGGRLFKAAIEVEKAKEQSRSLHMLYLQHSRYLEESREEGALDRARGVFEQGLRQCPTSLSLWEGAMALELRAGHAGGDERIRRIVSLSERAAVPPPEGTDPSKYLPYSAREALSARGVEFADAVAGPGEANRLAAQHAARFRAGERALAAKRSHAAAAAYMAGAGGAAGGGGGGAAAARAAKAAKVAGGGKAAGGAGYDAAAHAQWDQYYAQYAQYYAAAYAQGAAK